ncbi:MAG: chromosome segregation protein SMC, partial [Chloroflexota bacterium]
LLDRRERSESRLAQVDTTLDATRSALDEVGREVERLAGEQSELEREREVLSTELDGLTSGNEDAISAVQVEIAAASERLRSTERELQGLAQRLTETSAALEEHRTELESRRDAARGIDERRAEAVRQRETAAEAVAQAKAAHQPLEEQRRTLADQIAEAETRLDRTIARMREAERERDHAALDAARARDEDVFLAERIKNDLDIDDTEPLLEEAAEDATQIESDIRRLRERLRRMSAVGEDVLDEYETESARYEYLTEQLSDVDQAAHSLREVLHDLNRRMTDRFSATFTEVAREFKQTFKRLFGGGTAHLTLDDSNGDSTGIDIAARPPGKKLQGLNQLSGGERALTAVALLIAIQRVNPSPFCLLDEVDAALDESNVLRFRKELSDLATDIQFIVITHNRGTIEGADTLYGVTMGEDSVSRVLSLRLDQAIRAVEEEEPVESII